MPQIKPTTHEAEGFLRYYPDPEEPYNGLSPYWLIGDWLIDVFDGYHEIETEIRGEPARLELAYSKSGFAPRPQDEVDERLYEWELHFEGRGERKCHFNISPRFPEMRHHETGDEISVAFDHLDATEGVAVQYQSSNLDLDEIPGLLRRVVEEFAAAAGTDISRRYFDEPQEGVVNEVERYVRITREMNKKLVQQGGLIDRLSMLLQSESGTKGKRTWDNTEADDYHHQLVFGPTGAGELISHHRRGRQLKSYLPKHPDRFEEGDALYHVKFGCLFRKALNDRATRWEDRHGLIESLDESIINCLSWADIPVRVGDDGGTNGTFVADDHFDAAPRADSVPIHEDPAPRLEAKQDHLLMTILRDMTDADSDIVETVATDGGQHVEQLAESSGYSLSTIYRGLQRLDGVLQSQQGHVKFTSQKIAEEIRGIIQSAEYAVESAADRAAKLFDVEVNQRSNSAMANWLAEYGAEFEHDGNREKIRIDTVMSELKSRPHPHLPTVMDYLVHAWIADGRRRVNIEDVLVEVPLATGERISAPASALR